MPHPRPPPARYRALLTEDEQAFPGQRGVLQAHGPGHVVDGDDGQPGGGRVTEQVLGGVVVHEVLITVGDHGAPAVPASPAHDVHRVDGERIRGANDRPDVGVVAEVLDRDVQRMSPGIDIGDDRLPRPIAVGVNDVAGVAVRNSSGSYRGSAGGAPARGRHPGCRCSTRSAPDWFQSRFIRSGHGGAADECLTAGTTASAAINRSARTDITVGSPGRRPPPPPVRPGTARPGPKFAAHERFISADTTGFLVQPPDRRGY